VRVGPFFSAPYRASASQRARLDQILSVGRAFLAISGFVAIYLDPSEPKIFAKLTYGLLASYALYSMVVLLTLRYALRRFPRLASALHATDILWVSAINFFSYGPISPFFLFFLFVLVAAAYRWGFRDTFATALILISIFLMEATLATAGPWSQTFAPLEFDTSRFITRTTYLLLTGVLLGYLAEQEKRLHAEASVAAEVVRQTQSGLGFSGSVDAIARVLADRFDAARVDIIIVDITQDRAMRWTVTRALGAGVEGPPRPLKVPSRRLPMWLFSTPARAWYVPSRTSRAEQPCMALDETTGLLHPVRVSMPERFAALAFDSLAVVNVGLTGEWQGRIILFDPSTMPQRLPFLVSLSDQIAPVLANELLLRRLRIRATAIERARVARELHDGAIQSLIGIEMEIEALRRTVDGPARVAAPLGRIQDLVRQEVGALRELMQQLQPVDLEAPRQLPEVLTAVVEKFRRDTGITARFAADTRTHRLPLRTARELVRIVQEALANVRKHSHARNVQVRLTRGDGHFALTIDDDGRGFDFEGKLTGTQLTARRLGPAVILQRARIIRSALTLESSRSTGSRIEIVFDGN
jgi:signal transduction histidine kinase